MIYEAIDIWNSPSLEHHGVKGMKWGVRKTYHNVMAKYYRKAAVRAENRANRFKQNGKNGIYWVSENEAKEGAAIAKIDKKNFEKKAKEHENWKDKGLSKGQKIAIGVGVGAAVAVGVGVGAYVLKKNGMKPAPLTTKQLKSMGVKTFDYDTFKYNTFNPGVMKTPAKNIMRGPTTSRKLGVAAKNRVENSLDVANNNVLKAMRSRNKNIGNYTRKLGAANANYAKATINGPVYSYNGLYRPRYTTNSGNQIIKRLGRK